MIATAARGSGSIALSAMPIDRHCGYFIRPNRPLPILPKPLPTANNLTSRPDMANAWPAKNKYHHAMNKSNLAINMERGMTCTI